MGLCEDFKFDGKSQKYLNVPESGIIFRIIFMLHNKIIKIKRELEQYMEI